MQTSRIRLGADRSELGRLAGWLTAEGARRNWAPGLVDELNLVLEELVLNTMVHGFGQSEGPAAERHIEICLEQEQRGLEVRLTDNGTAFNPLDLAPPDTSQGVEERKVGGLGVFLARSMTSDLRYSRENGLNILTFRKETA